MAQIDTGLGWNAKDIWLQYNQDTILAEVGGFATSLDNTQPLPQISDPNEVYSKGKLIANRQNGFAVVYAACAIGTEGIVFISSEQNSYVQFFSPNHDFILYIGTTRYGTPQGVATYTGTSYTPHYQVYGNIGTTPIYYTPAWAIYINESEIINIPQVTKQVMFDSLSLDIAPITKDSEGYAVACVAKWKTPNGTILESPILISTESEYADMTTDIPGLDFAKLNVLYQGRKFYMGFYQRLYDGYLNTTLPVIDRSYSDAPTFTLEQLFKYIAGEVYANIQITNSPDPYQEETGESGEAGSDGEDDEADEIPFTDAPVSGIAYSGFLTIFTPNLAQLQSLASYMWSDFFDVDTWKKLFANPMDAILGLHIIPCSPGYSGNKEVKVGGKGTGVSMDYTTIRYHEVSMGTCTVPKKWGSYLDYNPYTKVSIFLPYIGFRDLDTDDVMDRTLALQYIVDILTGACVAELRCGTDVLYSWEGNCANPVPITSNSWSSAIGSAVSIAAAIATTALTHGASAPMIAGTVASVGANSMNLKPSVSRSGSLGGSGGFIAKQTPYIIRTVPNLVIPADQNKFIGYPSFVTASLGSLTGYNEISSIHLEGIPATGNELSEIETLLKGGVIF